MRLLAFAMLVTAVSFPASPIRAAQSAQLDATITGRVIDGGTQAPIAGARVMLLPAPTDRRPVPMGQPPTQVVTGDDGVYIFSGIAAGRYRLQVQKLGFVPPAPAVGLFQVGAGQSVAGQTFVLNRGSAISGRVLDVRGEPMTEVVVSAVRKPAAGFGSRPAPAMPAGQPGQTNDIGEFRISGLPAGDYYVTANPRPLAPVAQSSTSSGPTLATTFYPGVLTMAGAQVITVAAGQTIGSLEFTMMSVAGYSVSGFVVDEMNKTVGGAMVMLMPKEFVGPGPRGSARTQPDGTFKIGGVVPGAYRLVASVPVTVLAGGGTVTGGVPGGVTSSAGGIVTYSSSAGLPSMAELTVGEADVAGVTVVVRQR